jgi:hypothetical protein
MFKLSFILPIIFSFVLFVQVFDNLDTKTEPMTICHTFRSDDMRQFALDPDFQALHFAPAPLQYAGVGTNVTFKTTDGTDAKGYLVKAKSFFHLLANFQILRGKAPRHCYDLHILIHIASKKFINFVR